LYLLIKKKKHNKNKKIIKEKKNKGGKKKNLKMADNNIERLLDAERKASQIVRDA
jgi:hypothetical protein